MENKSQSKSSAKPNNSWVSYVTLALMAVVLVVFFYNYSGEVEYSGASQTAIATASTNPELEAAKDNALVNPGFVSYLNLGLAYYKAGQFQNCINITLKALEYPTSPQNQSIAYNNLCSAYNLLNRQEEAVKACEKSLALNPDYTVARNNLDVVKAPEKK